MNACTIAARNYFAHTQILVDSFFEHHPEGTFSVLVVDDQDCSYPDPRVRAAALTDIGIDAPELHRMAMMYDVTELATAVKPWFLTSLLARGDDHAVYFDPDIQIYSPLDSVADAAVRHSIVLTPHTLDPIPRDEYQPTERDIFLSGVFNLGFLGVSAAALPFLKWWSERLARDCIIDHNSAYFVDQRFVDMVPALFDHLVLRDPSCNVAYWNIFGRSVTCLEGQYFVDGKPLRFFHFSGYDPDSPYLLSKHQGVRPRVLLSQEPAVSALCNDYARKLLANGLREARALGVPFDRLPSGIRIDRRMRRLFRDEVLELERENRAYPPSPFDPATEPAFVDWLNAPVAGDAAEHPVSRYLRSVWSARPDVKIGCPDLDNSAEDRERFLQWLSTTGAAEEHIPALFLPSARTEAASSRESSAFTQGQAIASGSGAERGVLIAGYLKAELGIGEAARSIVAGVEHAGIAHATLTYTATSSRQAHDFAEKAAEHPHDINIVCVNADMLPSFSGDVGPNFFDGRYTIGLWFWEATKFPDAMRESFDFVDEVWVTSDFVADVVSEGGPSKPVLTMPLAVQSPTAPPLPRSELGLGDSFMFLFVFDFFSILERKNPLGLIEAFKLAFAPGEGPILVVKSINGAERIDQLERLRIAAAGRADITVMDEYLPLDKKNGLMAACDCYVSLHRSEGFGLTMAEAMALEKPVIATGYSGNLAFMTEANSYLVDYTMVDIPAGCEPYPAGAQWAEPDTKHAASLMREVYESADGEARERARRAKRDIVDAFSVEATAAFVQRRVSDIRKTWKGYSPAPAAQRALPDAESSQHPVAAVVNFVNTGPSVAWDTPSGRGVFGKAALKLVRRALRPYTTRQREFEVPTARALHMLHDQQQRQERELRALREIAPGELERLSRELQVHAHELRSKTHELQTHTRGLQQQADALQKHVQALTEQIQRSQASVAHLETHLHATPFLSDPSRLTLTDASGANVIGYEAWGGTQEAEDRYRSFEDVFRGSECMIRDRQRFYVDLVRENAPVLDVGCGRGEFLSLLAEAEVPASGIDLDDGMVRLCRSKGLEVELGDANTLLASRPDDSLGSIFMSQVIEHLDYDDIVRFLDCALQKLAPAGLLIIETVNPHSIRALKTFWVDLTHKSPVFPEVAVALCGTTGFQEARVVFPNGTGRFDHDRDEEGEYAVIARKAASMQKLSRG